MIPSDQIQAETEPDDVDAHAKSESTEPQVETGEDDAESAEDEAWLNACRQELADDDQHGASDENTDDLYGSNQETDDDENSVLPQASDAGAAITKTGDDVMSKFGHAIGALAESDEDFDDQALDYAAKMANPAPKRDEAVAPHIAAAERELERAKSSGPTDIFDRIAQAAESQFDESRGSTAKRVSELVDDRRVGTKRWTPSKTMKQRMEKLEAARTAAAGTSAAPTSSASSAASTATAGIAAAAGAAAVAASAPSSSTATMVTPGGTQAAEEERAEAQVETAKGFDDAQETVSRQQSHEPEADTTATESTAADAASTDFDDENTDNLRIIPGARGRRRDRARKSRLDEDFEKIFDDEGKPSINSLRRKLRSTASAEAEAAAAGDATTNGAASGGASEAEPKKGLFSRLLQPKAAKSAETATAAVQSDDDLVAAFETDEPKSDPNSDPNLVIDPSVDESWEVSLDEERKQNRLAIPIIGLGAAIALAGIGFFAYKFLVG